MKRDKGKTGVGRARGDAYDGPAVPSLVRLAKISFFSASCFFHNFCILAPNVLKPNF
jgi:hypothetical protein